MTLPAKTGYLGSHFQLTETTGYPQDSFFAFVIKNDLQISTPKWMEYTQKVTHFKHILGCTFFKIPITHTQSMFLLCKLFSAAIHSIGYFCHVTTLYVDEWKLKFLCPNR